MSVEFEATNWSDSDFVREYMEYSDSYILERERVLKLMASFYTSFIAPGGGPKRLLDLGSGDGTISKVLLEADPALEATLFDGSADMLEGAKKNLGGYKGIEYRVGTFQSLLLEGGTEEGRGTSIFGGSYNIVTSGLAIHHLPSDGKEALFKLIFGALVPGGYFLNMEVTRSTSEALQGWYRRLWEEWAGECSDRKERYDRFKGAIGKARGKGTSVDYAEPLDSQLGYLRSVGFTDVECYYKYGAFTLYGGKKGSPK